MNDAEIDAKLLAAKTALDEDGFPELSQRLTSLLSTFHTCTSCSVLDPETEQYTDTPPTTPLTEHSALLRLLLCLQGSIPSVRRRHVTFQYTSKEEEEDEEDSSPQQQPHQKQQHMLRSSIFTEAPNPDALFNNISTTSVYLPTDGNIPSSVFAGGDDIASLSESFSARPAWAPVSLQGLLPLESSGWLPITAALMEMKGDPRSAASTAAPPLHIPLSTLAMDRTPGAVTAFHQDYRSPEKVRPQQQGLFSTPTVVPLPVVDFPPRRGLQTTTSTAAMMDALLHDAPPSHVFSKERLKKEVLLGNGASLWTLEEAELARDAVLALQGVHSSLLRLRGCLAAAHALFRPATAGVLRRIERAAACRHRLQSFIDAFSMQSCSSSSSSSHFSSSSSAKIDGLPPSRVDPISSALAAALRDVLLSVDRQLAQLEAENAIEWVRGVQFAPVEGSLPGERGSSTLGGKILQGSGLSLTRVAVLTGKIQNMLCMLCSIFWCNLADVVAEVDNHTESKGVETPPSPIEGKGHCLCEWQVTPPPQGVALLDALFEYLQTADDKHTDVLEYIFARALQPYITFLQRWILTTSEIEVEHGFAASVSTAAEGDSSSLILSTKPPSHLSSGSASTQSYHANARRRQKRGDHMAIIPVQLPLFMAELQGPLVSAGNQLRLLQSVDAFGCKGMASMLCGTGSSSSNSSSKSSSKSSNSSSKSDAKRVMENHRWKNSFDGDGGDGGSKITREYKISMQQQEEDNEQGMQEDECGFQNNNRFMCEPLWMPGSNLDSSGVDATFLFTERESLARIIESNGNTGDEKEEDKELLSVLLTTSEVEELLQQRRQEEEHKLRCVDTWLLELKKARDEKYDAVKSAAVSTNALAMQTMYVFYHFFIILFILFFFVFLRN